MTCVSTQWCLGFPLNIIISLNREFKSNSFSKWPLLHVFHCSQGNSCWCHQPLQLRAMHPSQRASGRPAPHEMNQHSTHDTDTDTAAGWPVLLHCELNGLAKPRCCEEGPYTPGERGIPHPQDRTGQDRKGLASGTAGAFSRPLLISPVI